jgi:hypothetical protein
MYEQYVLRANSENPEPNQFSIALDLGAVFNGTTREEVVNTTSLFPLTSLRRSSPVGDGARWSAIGATSLNASGRW